MEISREQLQELQEMIRTEVRAALEAHGLRPQGRDPKAWDDVKAGLAGRLRAMGSDAERHQALMIVSAVVRKALGLRYAKDLEPGQVAEATELAHKVLDLMRVPGSADGERGGAAR